MKTKKQSFSAALAPIAIILILILASATASASTLNVGSTAKYKTIQSAVNAAKSGETIKVASGTYKETVKVPQGIYDLQIIGTKYPTVYGFSLDYSGAYINGFKITKTGIDAFFAGQNGIYRNNYLYNCGIDITGIGSSGETIMNNQISNGGIYLYDTKYITITGNTITGGNPGLEIGDMASILSVTKNTFKNCPIGVRLFYVPTGLIGNTYKNNKVNIKVVSI